MIKTTQHTQEPWVISDSGVAFYSANGEKGRADARRIVACVNACRGLSTDELEKSGLVSAVGTQIIEMEKQRDQLADALQELHDAISAGRYEDPSHDRIYQALIDSRAAIAAAKGGAA